VYAKLDDTNLQDEEAIEALMDEQFEEVRKKYLRAPLPVITKPNPLKRDPWDAFKEDKVTEYNSIADTEFVMDAE